MSSAKLGAGNLLVATEVATYNGPWVNPDEMRKLNGMIRYSQGTATDGFSITGMAYSNRWNSTDQVPERGIAIGQISRFGAEDPSDGGNTERFSLSGRLAKSDDAGWWKANAYVVQSSLDLFSNFTYFLSNPIQGDQFHQHDDRVVAGANVSRTFKGSLGVLPTETTFGIQTRYDAINIALTDTYQRAFLSNIRSDKVEEGSIGVYAENTVRWLPWLRTTLGSPLLVRTEVAEVGVRTKVIPGLDTSVSLFLLNQASEIVFQGDSGDTSASRPSQRYGVEWTNKYRPFTWMMIDGELAISHARFLGFDADQAALYASLAGFPQAQIGNAPGNFIPNAPAIIASAGITLGEKLGWYGGIRWRYLGEAPLTEDNVFRSPRA